MPDDAAFTWDSPTSRQPRPRPAASPAGDGVQWVTLRAAADEIGMAPSTIRRWAARGKVPTKLADTDQGVRRMVGLAEVRERAGARAAPRPARPRPAVAPSADDHMLVPREAWEKVLAQLGNLHEAGQQLAAARERAAKAETEAAFLRERLAELRDRAASGREPAAPPAPQPAQAPAPRWRALLRRVRGEPRDGGDPASP